MGFYSSQPPSPPASKFHKQEEKRSGVWIGEREHWLQACFTNPSVVKLSDFRSFSSPWTAAAWPAHSHSRPEMTRWMHGGSAGRQGSPIVATLLALHSLLQTAETDKSEEAFPEGDIVTTASSGMEFSLSPSPLLKNTLTLVLGRWLRR